MSNQTLYEPIQATPKPADRLVFSDPALIDTIYTSRHKKKPTWLTSTIGPVTTLFSISSNGTLRSFAVIHWDTNAPSKSDIQVEVNGQTVTAERFGVKAQGFLNKNAKSSTFYLGDLLCYWTFERYDLGIGGTSILSDAPVWNCYACTKFFAAPVSPPPTQSKWKHLLKPKAVETRQPLATYRPTYGTVKSAERMSIYPDGMPFIGLLLTSLILLDVKREDWKKVQSATQPADVEAVLRQDATGNLPMYTPERTDEPSTRSELHPTLPTTSPWRWTPPSTSQPQAQNATPRLKRSTSAVATELSTHS
ncbi:SubName: Full=Uncharacterized protein {ECO:0000313/EMBL:CCA68261.1} [Serendipita indica DSM 11827]|nr:SubName: Full=Uncharacterized protein {ECO:0000313/EMBL:CCA68261.1} [Serendipita indica DSM 11827]